MYRNIVAIIGMPRSGTSWLGQIFDSSPNVAYRLEPIFSYAFKNAVNEYSSREDFIRFFNAIYESQDDFLLQTDKRKAGTYPIFTKLAVPEFLVFKTTRFHHLMDNMLRYIENLKMVSIVRHPCGAINSWLNAPREFPANADPMEEWRSGNCRKTAKEEFWGFDDWKSVTLLHMGLEKRYPARFKLIRYEDLVRDTHEIVDELFRFAGIELEEHTARFLIDCHSRHDADSYSVFKDKNVAGRWKTTLPVQIQEEIIKDVSDTPLERFL
jgi:Sulfotransferase domain